MGWALLKLSDSERNMREELKTPLIIFGVFALLWAVYVAFRFTLCATRRSTRG
ncbi:MAG: hypothetical protein KIG62_04745 [Oscillospiraceae bacterium]|nr:hypothetical protein [Oscillospiraceae bacterium]